MMDELPASSTSIRATATDDTLRSEFIRSLIVTEAAEWRSSSSGATIAADFKPRALMQFWDDTDRVPFDVQECMDSWQPAESAGFERVLFSDGSAADFIEDHFTPRHVTAFASCGHPAMRADYFRLCYMSAVGGTYVDADDRLVSDAAALPTPRSRLYLQPLCYEIASDSMLNPFKAALDGPHPGRFFYVNNNPLIGPAGHPLIELALTRATDQVHHFVGTSRDVQSLTGPGNLSACLVEHTLRLQEQGGEKDYVLLRDWDFIAHSAWPLEYRADERNWRNWVRSNG